MNPSKKGNKRKRKRGGSQDAKSDQSLSHGASSASTKYTITSASSDTSLSFLTRHDPGFKDYVGEHYQGFAHFSVDELSPSDFHQQAKLALERLRDAKYYQYDIVMAGGKHSSRTFVKRTLVGNPGITYKYLGLRLFAHAWSGPGVSPLMRSICELNQNMIEMTRSFPNHQKCDYNLTLINYMEPTIHTKVGFKEEAEYGMGKVSVSWHADSSLESGSSIGVYHCLPTQRSSKWDWRIALRPSPDNSASKIVKPIVVDTKDGDAYFLLGNFNETHQHCVLAGSQANRISSTHRVAVTQEDTYDYILKRVKIARKRFKGILEGIDKDPSGSQLDAKVLRYCQRVLTEVEMEWISQYWLQGAQHDKMRTWWQRPMKTLEAYWRALEAATYKVYEFVLQKETHKMLSLDVIKVLVNEFKTRQSLREQWDERRADKIYQRRIVEEYRPVAKPSFEHLNKDNERRLPKDLTFAISELRGLLETRKFSLKSEEANIQRQETREESTHVKTESGSKQSSHTTNGSTLKETEEAMIIHGTSTELTKVGKKKHSKKKRNKKKRKSSHAISG